MKNIFCVLFLFVTILPGFGQRIMYKKAEKQLLGFEYSAAAESFEKIVEQNPSDLYALKCLALCYDKLNDPKKAVVWLARLCSSPEVSPLYYKSYAEALAANGDYTESSVWLRKYLETTPDVHADKTVQKYSNLESFYIDSSNYAIEKLALNSEQSDFSPAFYENGIMFCSAAVGAGNKTLHAWDNTPFIDLYWVTNPGDQPKSFGKPINSPFHEGPATLTPNADTLFFTRNNSSGNRHSPSRDGIVRLHLFYSVKKNGAWQKEQRLGLNSDLYSIGHPTFSSDHWLYFVSDKPGGYGGTDIYVSRMSNGMWSAPANLGPHINTPGNEMFPFIDEKGDLYFASDTHPGLGGLDIFHSKKENQSFGLPKNLGYPVNSSKDDFGLIVKDNRGFFSSNRGVNPKDDNIYSMVINKTKSLVIVAMNNKGKMLETFDITLTKGGDEETKHVKNILLSQFDKEKKYLIECTKEGYNNQTFTLEASSMSTLRELDTIKMVLVPKLKTIHIILQSADGRKLAGGSLTIKNMSTGEVRVLTSDTNGTTTTTLDTQTDFEVTGSQAEHNNKTINLSVNNLEKIKEEETIPMVLSLKNTLFEKNEIGQIIELDIRYDVGKSSIRKDAASELDKLVAFLKKNMTVKVELGSHTDIRGSEEANHALSQKRAEAAVLYIVAKGIDSKRLIPVGYGERNPKVKEATNEEGHQQNRRTTVKIVGI